MYRGLKANSSRAFLEPLESRTLFSSLNVLSYGAVANDGKDDSGAIRAAISDSHDGDTIFFPAGNFELASTVHLRGDRTYLGRGGKTVLHGMTTKKHIFYIQQDNITVEHLTFDGKPILIDRPGGGMIEDLLVDNNTFHVHAKGANFNGITFTTGLRNSSITNNRFDPIAGDNGIYGYYWDHLTIANNLFLNGNEGIHVVDFNGDSKYLLIEQNYFSGLHRMGIEYQGGGTHTVVQDNFYENPLLSKNQSANGATFAYSIIADRSVGTIIRRNTSIAPQRPDGIGVRIIFEVGGDNTLVEQNYSVAGNHVLAANDGEGTTSVLAKNNLWKDYRQGPSGRGLTLQDNGPDVQLDWNIDRGRPGPNKRLGMLGYVSTIAK